MLHVAGSFCVVKSPAHLTNHSTHCQTALPWIQRSGRCQLFAARPTINTTIGAGARQDRRSLCCDGYRPCRSGGGSIGGVANGWRPGTSGNPGSSCEHAPALFLNNEGNKFVLCLGQKDANIVVVSQLDHLQRLLANCPRVDCVVLAMDGPNREIFLKVEGCGWVHVLLC
jgi:hypothetical protein